MRRSKFDEVAAALEARIDSNEWEVNHRLPTVRELADEYDVAAATASRAFEVLRGKGIVRPDERSRVYRVVDRNPSLSSIDRWAICLRVTPGPWYRGSLSIICAGFIDPIITAGIHLDFNAVSPDLNLPPLKLREVVEAAKAAGLTGLFLMPSRISAALADEDERLMEACRQCGFPVVLIDRDLRGVHRQLQWDLVTPDYMDGGYQCAMHLYENGRRRLAFVRASPTSSHTDMLSGVLLAHQAAKARESKVAKELLVYDFNEESGGRHAYLELCDRVLADKVDGVVCFQDRVVIGLAIDLMKRNCRVPDDIALTGFDDQPIGSEFTLGVTTYVLPSRELAARAFQVMRARLLNPEMPPMKVLIPSRLLVRESTIKGAKGRKSAFLG